MEERRVSPRQKKARPGRGRLKTAPRATRSRLAPVGTEPPLQSPLGGPGGAQGRTQTTVWGRILSAMGPKKWWSDGVRGAAGRAYLGVAALSLACCTVPPPTVQQGLDYGFRTPKQTFESWRTAVQGNMLAEEYRCFSRRWKRENSVSSLQVYGEIRDKVLSEVPQIRWAVYRAEEPELLMLNRPYAVLQARIPGPLWIKDRFLVVSLFRDGYWAAFDEQSPMTARHGAEYDDIWKRNIFRYEEEYDSFRVFIDDFSEETRDAAPDAILEARAGFQWKILRFAVFDQPFDPAEDAEMLEWIGSGQ